MCLILVGFQQHADYPIVLAANRDEYYARPTALAAPWDDAPEVFGGRDLQAGGSWFAVSRDGRFAAVTNYRDAGGAEGGERSRGMLVNDYLLGAESPLSFVKRQAAFGADYRGFNLLVGSAHQLAYYSNRDAQSPRDLSAGVYGLSNHLLDTPWPKVERGKMLLQKKLQGPDVDTEGLLDLLADTTPATDQALPDTGVGKALERQLSPMFIQSDEYGTRCSTLCLIDNRGRIQVVERSYASDAQVLETVRHEFEVVALS